MIVTFDIGTSIIKGALFSPEGEVLVSESRRLNFLSKSGAAGDENEIDPRIWLGELESLCRSLLEKNNGANVSILCISGNGPSLVAADENARPVYPALSWLDRRGTKESREIQEKTGKGIDPSFYLPKVLWLKNNRREAYNKARFFLGCPEYILYFLTGNPCNIITGPLLGEYTWSRQILEKLELPESKFPRDIKPGTIIGGLLPEAAGAWGLPANIPVVAGGPDFVLTLLGSAAVFPGRVCDRTGTSEGINLCSTKLNPDPRLMSFEHPVEGLYNTSGSISNSGRALDWFMQNFFDAQITYDEIFALAETVPPGSRGLIFLPYLSGERAPLWDPRLRGAFAGLSARHGKAEMLRAVLEGVAFALRHVIQTLEEPGEKVEDLRICGAPGGSPVWNQIKADICGRTILRPKNPQAELAGGAIFCLRALNRIPDLAQGAEDLFLAERTYTPCETNKTLYDELYEIYRRAGETLAPASRELADRQK